MNQLFLILKFLSIPVGDERLCRQNFPGVNPNLIKFSLELIKNSPKLVEHILENKNDGQLILEEALENWKHHNPEEDKSSLSKFIDIIFPDKIQKILWYPACGEDLKVLHHPSTNNISVSNDFFILSDIMNYDETINDVIRNEGFNVIHRDSGTFYFSHPDLQENVTYTYLVLKFDNGYIQFERKCLFLWQIPNEDVLQIFFKIPNFKLETLFVKRYNDDFVVDKVRATLDQFSCRYYINSFYTYGMLSNAKYNEVIEFGKAQGLQLKAISGYGGVGNNNPDSLEFVFTFVNTQLI
jgi:hypothetical protein